VTLPEKAGNFKVNDVLMREATTMMTEAVVEGQMPEMTVVDDTVMYNADAFKLPEGSVVEDLIKKLPGIEVDENGKYTWNGKEISQILLVFPVQILYPEDLSTRPGDICHIGLIFINTDQFAGRVVQPPDRLAHPSESKDQRKQNDHKHNSKERQVVNDRSKPRSKCEPDHRTADSGGDQSCQHI
jgi:hypothetical protein